MSSSPLAYTSIGSLANSGQGEGFGTSIRHGMTSELACPKPASAGKRGVLTVLLV